MHGTVNIKCIVYYSHKLHKQQKIVCKGSVIFVCVRKQIFVCSNELFKDAVNS